ncbi:MAG: hypothetical protein WAM14_08140 [Candidatus Nitrosopolaris sp.]
MRPGQFSILLQIFATPQLTVGKSLLLLFSYRALMLLIVFLTLTPAVVLYAWWTKINPTELTTGQL